MTLSPVHMPKSRKLTLKSNYGHLKTMQKRNLSLLKRNGQNQRPQKKVLPRERVPKAVKALLKVVTKRRRLSDFLFILFGYLLIFLVSFIQDFAH